MGLNKTAGLLDAAAATDPIWSSLQSGLAYSNAETKLEKVQALDPTGLTSLPFWRC